MWREKRPEMVAAERGWKEPECPPQAGGRTAASPTVTNLILMHFMSKLVGKEVITAALCSRYLIITKNHRTCILRPEDSPSRHMSQWHGLSVDGKWAPTHTGSGTSQDGCVWQRMHLLAFALATYLSTKFVQENETLQSKVNQHITSHSCYHENKRPHSYSQSRQCIFTVAIKFCSIATCCQNVICLKSAQRRISSKLWFHFKQVGLS